MQNATRSYIDCRDFPSEKNCTLRISGTDQEVLQTAEAHAVSAHGHEKGPQLSDSLRKALKPEN